MGVELGGWVTTGARVDQNAASGYRLAGSVDGPAFTAARWRVQGAFVQAGYTRDFATGPSKHATENSLELAAHLLSSPIGSGTVRGFVGPAISVGIGCGTDGSNDPNGRIACGTDTGGKSGTIRVGAAAGVRAEWGSTRQFTLELQGQGNSIAAVRGKGPAIVVSAGLRLPR
jgi:hypothetical protein